jgi:hypothetical protein
MIGYRRHFVRVVVHCTDVVTWPLDPGEREPATDKGESVVVIASRSAAPDVVRSAIDLALRVTNGPHHVPRLWVGPRSPGGLAAPPGLQALTPLGTRGRGAVDVLDAAAIANVLAAYADFLVGLPTVVLGELMTPAARRLTGPSLDVLLDELEELAWEVVFTRNTWVVVGHPDFADRPGRWSVPLVEPWLRARIARAMHEHDPGWEWIWQRRAVEPYITVVTLRGEQEAA